MDTYKNNKQLNELIMLRSYGYMFLKRAFFIEPNIKYIEALSKEEYVSSFPFRYENDNIGEGIKQIENYLSKDDVLRGEVHNKLQWDFTRMFIGPNALPAPPWESSYLNKDKLLFQEETLQVRRSYLKYNFIPENYPHEADDHIALELDFMYRLTMKLDEVIENQEKEKMIEILQDQKHFLEYHLTKWVPQFSNKIIENAKTDYYNGLAKILKGFIEIDYQIILELLDNLAMEI